ncbi:tRNA lysidine(34) synthetase TilS [Acetilactobacillus jinshanensis]|uniref:tRNA(Ile)-lysidine synthase n=1 Tax=Acetilactobacillus jinshanensis TaxID=1720083 RepID=A0A4P6ZMN2_9LACO|nr:tRNA lysidine(34) synthetase TilS [Acetilactobacillus jinshanensis]QBP18867.1 tRNA lysidine(34) synthetase TilS [Acetilactobacillus jinshanensis]URL60582.1 tRNA lysidine(34) synthetase TilS [uncultured bacterium]
MNLVKRLASEVKRNRWWTRKTRVVIGVSTGVDSMVLLYLLEHLKYYRPQIIVAHVNHELRKASVTEEKYIRKYCHQHHLTLVVAHWRKQDHPKTGTENAAREFRYRFFKHVMRKHHASVMLTAHHLNDQDETVLMRLIRGGDIRELTGIHRCRKFANGYLIRPLLQTPKHDLRKFAVQHHIKWYEDRTNYSLKITRNRMRHRLLPWMTQEDPRAVFHIGSYVHQLTLLVQDNMLLNARLIKPLKTDRDNWWKLDPLMKSSRVIQLGMLHELFRQFDSQLMITPPMMHEVIILLNDNDRPQGRIAVGNQRHLQKDYHQFGIVKDQSLSGPNVKSSFSVKLNQWYRLLNGDEFGVFGKPLSQFHKQFKFNLSKFDFPLKVRQGQSSDVLRLKNGGHQKVRRIWIDKKLSNHDRNSSQILKTKNGFSLALLGVKASFTEASDNAKPYWLIVKRAQKRG